MLLCLFFELFAAFFGFIIKVLSHIYYPTAALCSCVTVFYRSLSVFVFTAFAGDYESFILSYLILYLRSYIDNPKQIVKQQYLIHMSSQYGEL